MGKNVDRYNLDDSLYEIRENTLEKIYSKINVPDAVLAIADLEIYSDSKKLFSRVSKAIKFSDLDSDITLTNEQTECIDILSKGNLFVSAPTSFGKTYIALEHIARNFEVLNNIVFVVPTIALMNELRKKCYFHFGKRYTLITSDAELKQYYDETKKIMIVVPERISTSIFKNYFNSNDLDFLVYDEIYKLNANEIQKTKDDARSIVMNYIYHYLIARAKKILLLGPFIKDVSFGRSKIEITKYITNLNLVYNNIHFDENYSSYFGSALDKRFVYFDSPKSISNFLSSNQIDKEEITQDKSIIDWMSKQIHPDWYYIKYLKKGIGIHHGKTPIFLRKYIEREYSEGNINTILCTSTLIEGINTPTNSLFIHDKPRGVFELNNLVGRVGRLNVNDPKIGHIYINKKEIFDMYDPKSWIDLKIIYEDERINSSSPEDECLYLNKEPNVDVGNNLKKTEDLLRNNFNIDYKEIMEYGIEYKVLNKFIINYDRIVLLEKEYDVFKEIKFSVLTGYNRYSSGLKIENYSFKSMHEELGEYLSFDCVYQLLVSTGGMNQVINMFTSKYSYYSEKDINLFIDTLFEIDEFIKFKLTKIVPIFELFNDKKLFDKKKNRAFIQCVNMIKSYGALNNGIERILEDYGFPKDDIVIIMNSMKHFTTTKGTENILKEFANHSTFNSLSPFGKKIIEKID